MKHMFAIIAALLGGCGVDDLSAHDAAIGTLAQQAYLKASNTGAGDLSGHGVALSADGSTLAVGAPWEDSAASGVGGDQTDDSAPRAGAVYVFTRKESTWIQEAYLKASNAGRDDLFGFRVALSADGSTLAVGAPQEASSAIGVGGDQKDDGALHAGAVYVFARGGAAWAQQAYVKASNTGAGDRFGSSVALSADGSTLAVGAPFEDGGATGIGGDPSDDAAPDAGAVYVFARGGAAWSERAYVKASNTAPDDRFGSGVALSGDGSILAVGAIQEDSAALGVGGDQGDHAAGANAGAVYVFSLGAGWAQQAYVKASNTGAEDRFGYRVALSDDGKTLAVSARSEASAAKGVGANQANDAARGAGAVYLFERGGTTWSQTLYIKASNTGIGDFFGESVALSGDGSTLAVGAAQEASAAIGIDGDQVDNSAPGAGAVYRFARSGATWFQTAYLKASNTGTGDFFGESVALSADGAFLAVGAHQEDSAATGIGGDQADDSAELAGAVYVYR